MKSKKIKRENKKSNLDFFAGYISYIQETEKPQKTAEENVVSEDIFVNFPSHKGNIINFLV